MATENMPYKDHSANAACLHSEPNRSNAMMKEIVGGRERERERLTFQRNACEQLSVQRRVLEVTLLQRYSRTTKATPTP